MRSICCCSLNDVAPSQQPSEVPPPKPLTHTDSVRRNALPQPTSTTAGSRLPQEGPQTPELKQRRVVSVGEASPNNRIPITSSQIHTVAKPVILKTETELPNEASTSSAPRTLFSPECITHKRRVIPESANLPDTLATTVSSDSNPDNTSFDAPKTE